MLILKDGRNYNYRRTTHGIKYISWAYESLIAKLDDDEWDEMIDNLDDECRISDEDIVGRKTVRALWHSGDWHFDAGKGEIFLYQDGEYFIYTRNDKAVINDKKVAGAGKMAYEYLQDEFYRRHNFKFQKAFGAFQHFDNKEKNAISIMLKQGIHHINRCNGPFIAAEEEFDDKITEGVCKADVSSAYPYAGCGRLPDAHDYKLIYGCEEPDEEYPFAFYLKSGHIAEYGVFDTHKDQWSYLFQNYRNPDHRKSKKGEEAVYFSYVPDDEEITVLMKACQYELTDLFQHFYDKKNSAIDEQERDAAKLVMNAAIGRFDYIMYRKNEDKSTTLLWDKTAYKGHLRAVILARHNHYMIELYNSIKKNGGRLVSIQTDAMTWIGSPIPEMTQKKAMGNFCTEIVGGRVYQHHCGCYCIEDNNQIIIKYQGVKNFPVDKVNSMEDFIDFFINNEIEIVDRLDAFDENLKIKTKKVK